MLNTNYATFEMVQSLLGVQAVLKYYCSVVGTPTDSQLAYLSVHRGLIAEEAPLRGTEKSLQYEPNSPS